MPAQTYGSLPMPNLVSTAQGIRPLLANLYQKLQILWAVSPHFYTNNDDIWHARAELLRRVRSILQNFVKKTALRIYHLRANLYAKY